MQGIYKDKSNNRRNCYSIISDENSDTYGHGEGGVIYGYNSFDNDTVFISYCPCPNMVIADVIYAASQSAYCCKITNKIVFFMLIYSFINQNLCS